MLLNKLFQVLLLFIYLFSALHAEAQKNKSNNKTSGKKKTVKFIAPTPISPDHLKEELLQRSPQFFWQFEKDTNLPPYTLFREEMEFLEDSVIFKRFITKQDMRFRNDYYQLFDTKDNASYKVETAKAHYKIYYETLSVWNAITKKYNDFILTNEDDYFMMDFTWLVRKKTSNMPGGQERKYKSLHYYLSEGTVSDEPVIQGVITK